VSYLKATKLKKCKNLQPKKGNTKKLIRFRLGE